MSLLQQFTLELLTGIALMLCVMPSARVASGFYRVQMLVLLGLSVLLALTTTGNRVLPLTVAGMTFVGSALWMLERRSPAMVLIYAIGAVSLFQLLQFGLSRDAALPRALWLVSDLASAGTLGAAMTGMLLGHRYLTAPGMPLAPLQALNAWLGAASLLRLGVSTVAWMQPGPSVQDTAAWTWLGLRWLAGIVGPMLAAVLVWRILKYRNTQAATGVLFTAVILTFIGELAAQLLALQVQRPM